MQPGSPAPTLSRIRLYPIKSLNPVEVPCASIGPNGGLEMDRVWAILASDGRWINGKRTKAVDGICARFAPDLQSVELAARDGHAAQAPAHFEFPADTASAARWFSQYFQEPVTLLYAREGLPDDDLAPGPTIVSTASFEAICQWFPEISLDAARLRFRASLELGGMQPFEEDQLFAADAGSRVNFSVGDVRFEGSNPCARCSVPPRDPVTGNAIADFQRRFADLRRTHLPAWSPATRFDHFYRFAVNTRVPASEIGKVLRVGDSLTFSPGQK
jgi:uncharacterized protein YcbX